MLESHIYDTLLLKGCNSSPILSSSLWIMEETHLAAKTIRAETGLVNGLIYNR